MNNNIEFIIYTIGVYAKTEDDFFNALTDNRIRILVDVRNRRGMRGAKYKFVNSIYLQKKLDELGIAYLHAKAFSPNAELRDIQKAQDKQDKTLKSQRKVMAPAFVEEYKRSVLANQSIEDLMTEIKTITGEEDPRLCLFCVEASAEACHRSIIAEAIGVEVCDL
ncbi:MAG: DUF488 domain-containing protein [Candidatus Hatepunaea meridiana]|nr:DUF488 domain-containing protein [Candidatus Hatepunaea meridiana]